VRDPSNAPLKWNAGMAYIPWMRRDACLDSTEPE
jgi:hypothetical protein